MYKEIIKPTLVLILISVIVAGMLALAYNMAHISEIGNGISQEQLDQYVKEVLPKGTKLANANITLEDAKILGIYKDEGGAGVAIHLITKGYGGDLKILVGLDKNGVFTGAKILETKETPELGTKIGNKSFIDKYLGKSKNVAVTKDGGDIDAITGATISSRAFTAGVNKAFEIFDKVKGEL